MKINRMSIALGLTVGLLAGGAGAALAATTRGSSTSGTSATTMGAGDRAWGGDRCGPGWSGYGGHAINSRYGDVGPMTFRRSAIGAAAGYLELTSSGLKSRLRSGQTLADLAISHKSCRAWSAIVAAINSRVHSGSALSAGQKAAIIAGAKRPIGSIVDNTSPMGSRFGSYYGPMTRH